MKRETEEVKITVEVEARGGIETGDPVLDHLLETLFFYMGKEVRIEAKGDLRHHLWEDLAICLGEELSAKLGDRKIARFGRAVMPMDDALVLVVVDVSRSYLDFRLDAEEEEEGFSLGLVREFLMGLSRSTPLTLHVEKMHGFNVHHVIEACFKGLGVALGEAFAPSTRLESTKGEI